MPVLVFLLDTSASMNQRTYLGTSALDLAKGAVETFLKVRMGTFVTRVFTKEISFGYNCHGPVFVWLV